jgi:hypothetical protein
MKKGFKGNCRICGKFGHRGNECWHNDKKESTGTQQKANEKSGTQQLNSERSDNSNSNLKICRYCKKPGHVKANCFKLANKLERDKKVSGETHVASTKAKDTDDDNTVMVAMIENGTVVLAEDDTRETWIGDTGATAHMTNSLCGFTNIRHDQSEIKFGNGNYVSSPLIGDKHLIVMKENGKECEITLCDCKYVPSLFTNLLSLTKALSSGWKIESVGVDLLLQRKDKIIKLKQTIKKRKSGYLLGIDVKVKEVESAFVLKVHESQNKKIEINDLHKKLGHPGEKKLMDTIKMMDIKTVGKLRVCKDCAIGKARQKNVNKLNEHKSIIKAERLYIDISSTSDESFGGSNFWILIVDEATRMKWSFFIKQKSDLAETLIKFLKSLEQEGNIVQYIRCDNSGENNKFRDMCIEEKFKIKFEFTAPNTPQQNGIVERAFATLYGRIRAMLNGSGFSDHIKRGLWTECASTATFLDNILSDGENTSAFKKFYDKNPSWIKNLRTFGEPAIVTDRSMIKGKLSHRGIKVYFVGYCSDHPSDVFRFFKPDTKRVIRSRDIVWLHTSNDIKEKNVYDDMSEKEKHEEEKQKDSEKTLLNALKKLNTFYNPTLLGMEDVNDTMLISAVDSGYAEPQNFEEAWYHPNPIHQKNGEMPSKKNLMTLCKRKCGSKPTQKMCLYRKVYSARNGYSRSSRMAFIVPDLLLWDILKSPEWIFQQIFLPW